MRKNKKVFFIFIGFIYFLQVIVHAGADAFAGGEEVFNGYNFIIKHAFVDGFSILVYKVEWFHLAYRWYGLFSKARDKKRHDSNEADKKQDKESNVEEPFFGHKSKVICCLLVIMCAGLLKLNFKHLYAKVSTDMLIDHNI